MKTLTIKFTFTIMPDEFGLYSLPEDAKIWINAQRDDADLNAAAVMEVLPIEDAPTPGGLTQVRKRTRGPGRKNAANETLIPAGDPRVAQAAANGAGQAAQTRANIISVERADALCGPYE